MHRLIVPVFKNHEVWLLTGSQSRYGENPLRQRANQSRAIAQLAAGGPHRSVIPMAVGMKVFEDSAAIATVELLTIDAPKTHRDFAKEVRWNEAYYRRA